MEKSPSYFSLAVVGLLIIGASIPASAQNVSPANRTECPETTEKPRPPNRVDTTAIVTDLRNAMNNVTLTGGQPLDAYITLISDDHGTSGSAFDQRVTYLSGFTGSNGYTIITQNDAALWTDGRYFLQAEYQMECFWILMKISTPGYTTGPAWLADILPANARVGAYPNYVSRDTWKSYEDAFAVKGIIMVPVEEDLVDIVWSKADANRPEKPANPLIIHPIEFAGKTTAEKLVDVRRKLSETAAQCLVVTVLEETNWLFNLRGTDRTDSLFYGYSIIYTAPQPSILFINNVARALADANLRSHLRILANGDCAAGVTPGDCIQLREYTDIESFIRNNMPGITPMWVDPSASQAIYAAVGSNRVLLPLAQSPIALMKAIKNPVESKRFFECILRDSAAVVEFIASLEPQIRRNVHWTENSASAEVKRIRSQYEHFKGLSFESISAVGPNAAVIHYRANDETDRQITTNEVYLLDSGGQYMDGTTDVTRTFHFGTPTDMEKEAYTRVLMGAIDLALTVWPSGYYGSDIDVRARAPLWQKGWDYNHGTGHGIGYFLSVHEGPGRINIGYNPSHAPLYEGMFFSDEPGYYEDGKFGIRLETLVGVVKANTTYQFGDRQYLGFLPATLVPFEPNLIKYELLTHVQIEALNSYHARCEAETGAYLLNVRKNQTAYDWLVSRTKPISVINAATTAASTSFMGISVIWAIISFLVIY